MNFQEMFKRVRDRLLFTNIRPVKVRNKSWPDGYYYIVNEGMNIEVFEGTEKLGKMLGFSDADEKLDDWEFVV